LHERFGGAPARRRSWLRKAFLRWPDAGALGGSAGKLPVRCVLAVASALAGSTKGESRQAEPPVAHALDPRQRKSCERHKK
jgi:hypothetical protein